MSPLMKGAHRSAGLEASHRTQNVPINEPAVLSGRPSPAEIRERAFTGNSDHRLPK